MAIESVPINTGTGPQILADQSGTAYAQIVKVAQGGDGTFTYADTFAISGTVTSVVASITTGTVSIVGTPAVTAANVTIASITTGTVSVINVVSATGVLLAATTANVGAFVGTAHASRWDAFAVNTTSGASVIVKTSGANTLYVTAMLVSADVAARVDILSAATTKLSVYLATKGGFALPVSMESPMVLNSAQSLTFQPSVSGSCSCWAAGYTVT